MYMEGPLVVQVISFIRPKHNIEEQVRIWHEN
jgi:hypothetical protein